MPRLSLTLVVVAIIFYIVGAMYPGVYNQLASNVRGAMS